MDLFHAYLINLDSSTERLRQVTGQFQAAGLPFERVSAFDGRNIDVSAQDDADPEACLRVMGRSLQGGEYGCYKSHLACAQRIVDAGHDYGLVFEDDIRISSSIVQVLPAILEHLNACEADWDVVHLAPDRLKLFSPVGNLPDGHALVAAHYFPMAMSALLWSNKGARRFVEENAIVRIPVDNQLRQTLTRSGRGYAVWPALVRQLGYDSDIGPRRDDGRRWSYPLLKQKRHLLSKVTALYHMARHRWKIGRANLSKHR